MTHWHYAEIKFDDRTEQGFRITKVLGREEKETNAQRKGMKHTKTTGHPVAYYECEECD